MIFHLEFETTEYSLKTGSPQRGGSHERPPLRGPDIDGSTEQRNLCRECRFDFFGHTNSSLTGNVHEQTSEILTG